jgi:hypothetical protein
VRHLILALTLCTVLDSSAALAGGRPLVAVLDLGCAQAKLSEAESAALTNTIRKQALDLLSGRYDIITRENLIDLLSAHGKRLERCIGECETETGRLIGAELVITGTVSDVFGSFRLDLKAHRTDPPTFLAAEEASTKERSDLPRMARDSALAALHQAPGRAGREGKGRSAPGGLLTGAPLGGHSRFPPAAVGPHLRDPGALRARLSLR